MRHAYSLLPTDCRTSSSGSLYTHPIRQAGAQTPAEGRGTGFSSPHSPGEALPLRGQTGSVESAVHFQHTSPGQRGPSLEKWQRSVVPLMLVRLTRRRIWQPATSCKARQRPLLWELFWPIPNQLFQRFSSLHGQVCDRPCRQGVSSKTGHLRASRAEVQVGVDVQDKCHLGL